MKKIAYIILSLILIVSASLMVQAARKDSAIVDEIPHIGAAYAYLHLKDYRLNPEHPPLTKDMGALPLQFMKLNYPTNTRFWQKDVNGQWEQGRKFIYNSGNNADKIIFWARMGMIFLTLLTILFVYKWTKELIGPEWALMPTFLFAFSPLVLAHGHYVTTDIGATFGFLIGLYYFLKFIEKPIIKNSLKLGITLGIALMLKFSVFFLLPIIALIYLVILLYKLTKKNYKYIYQSLIGLGVAIFISLVSIYTVYLYHTWNQPLKRSYRDASFILQSFAGGPDKTKDLATCKIFGKENDKPISFQRHLRCIAEFDLKLFKHKSTLPFAQYLLGLIMVIQRSTDGNIVYFLGYVGSSGWWYYFPIVFLLKEPLPSLILILLGVIFAFSRWLKKTKEKLFDSKEHDSQLQKWSMISLIVFYWAYSMKSSLNIGLRHILPTIPFIYILTSASIKKWVEKKRPIIKKNFWQKLFLSISEESKHLVKFGFIFVLLVWYLFETFSIAPQFIAYFNQLAGGPANGYKYVVDSNLDWGQDLKRLAIFVRKHHIRNLKLDYFGWADPTYYLKNKVHYWASYKGYPKDGGYLAISLTTLQNAKGKLWPGQKRNPQDEYRWLKNPYKPYARIGYSIFLYKLPRK